MKDMPDLKEIMQIFILNARSTTWFLTSATCTTFEALFDQILVYEELVCAGGIKKTKTATSIHILGGAFATNDYHNCGRNHQEK